MSGTSTAMHNGHMMPSAFSSSSSSNYKDTTKPLLQSILQTENAAVAFTKKPSSTYQIEYTSSNNIYNPQAINSMATSSSSSSSTFSPTKTAAAAASFMQTTTTKALRHHHVPSSTMTLLVTTTTASTTKQQQDNDGKHYVQPDMHVGWPVYNLIIEGHSKVKTYGLKGDEIGKNLPMIRPVQSKENPIVDRTTDAPEFSSIKHVKGGGKLAKKAEDKKSSSSAMSSLLSLLDGSFGNFLSGDGGDSVEVRRESEIKAVKNYRDEKRKTRSIPDDDGNGDEVNNKQERVFSVSFQVDERDNIQQQQQQQHQVYRKGTVITENLFPFQSADRSR